jgi:hypothetical protein
VLLNTGLQDLLRAAPQHGLLHDFPAHHRLPLPVQLAQVARSEARGVSCHLLLWVSSTFSFHCPEMPSLCVAFCACNWLRCICATLSVFTLSLYQCDNKLSYFSTLEYGCRFVTMKKCCENLCRLQPNLT